MWCFAGYCRAGKLQKAWSLFTSAEALEQEPHSYATYQGLISCAVKVRLWTLRHFDAEHGTRRMQGAPSFIGFYSDVMQ